MAVTGTESRFQNMKMMVEELEVNGEPVTGGAPSVSWDDVTDKPTFGTASAADTSDFATAAQGSTADSAVQPGDLAAVATSGSYADLTNTPTLGTAAAANVGAAVPDVSDPPTQAEVNALLASLRTAGLIAT